jgi:hypothetical protein
MTAKLDKPYRQNVWVYAANQAIALPISSLPFVIFREQRRTRELCRDKRGDALREALPGLPDRWVQTIAFIGNHRERFTAIPSMAPWLPPYEL